MKLGMPVHVAAIIAPRVPMHRDKKQQNVVRDER